LDNGNTIVVQGTVFGLSGASHVSGVGGKILMTGSNLSTRCIKGGNFAIGNLEIDPGVEKTIYDSTSFSIVNLTLTSGTFLFSPGTTYKTSIIGSLYMNGGNLNLNSGDTLLFKNNSSIVRSAGVLTNSGTLSIGTAATHVVNIVFNGNFRSTGELPSTYAPGKIDLTINNGFKFKELSKMAPHYPNVGLWLRFGIWWSFVN
jgi:hypothetical protein